MKLALSCTAFSITSRVARKVVTIPVIGCKGLPSLTVSTVSEKGDPGTASMIVSMAS